MQSDRERLAEAARRSDRDRELLELAAKAIGGRYRWQYTNDAWSPHHLTVFQRTAEGVEYWPPTFEGTWNPLTDDGDALRLAVARWIEIRVFNGKAHAGKQGEFWCTEDCGLDPNAATRRAIVRAAAELAQAHPDHKDGGENA